MAKNLQQKGDTLTFVAGAGGVSSGEFVLVEGALVVALYDAAEGEEYEATVTSVYRNAPAVNDEAFANFAELYWNGTALTTDDGTGVNPRVGRCVGGKAETATTCSVLLLP